jgi:hypothetical protein
MTTFATSPAVERDVLNLQRSVDLSPWWQGLYRIGSIGALLVVALMPLQIAVFMLWPPPTKVIGWFELLQQNALVGLLNLDLALIVDYVLLAALFLALFVALRSVHPAFAALFLVLELLAAAIYFASAVAFEMLAASALWANAASELERTTAIAAGQTLLLTWQGTAFGVSYVLAGAAMLLVGVVMLRGGPFGKVTAWSAVLGGALGLIPASAGTIGIIASLASLLPLSAWLIGTGRTLWGLARR